MIFSFLALKVNSLDDCSRWLLKTFPASLVYSIKNIKFGNFSTKYQEQVLTNNEGVSSLLCFPRCHGFIIFSLNLSNFFFNHYEK